MSSVRHLLDASAEAIAWWDARRAADPTLPNGRVVRPAGGEAWRFEPPELRGYFLACFEHHRQPLPVIAWGRWSRKWQRLIAQCRALLSLWRG